MEDKNDNNSILTELKAHFKELPSEIIEILYQENNKDITKTIDALIENVNLSNLYDKENKEDKINEINENKNIEEEDEDSDDDFFLFRDEGEKEEKIDNKNEIEKDKMEEEKTDKKIEDNILKFLIELAPFNTSEEIQQKMEYFNFDIDKVISSLLGDDSNSNISKEKDKSKLNYENNYLDKKRNKLSKNGRVRKTRKYDENKVLEFIEKNKNKNRIDLHGFKLTESMFIVKNKLEEMEKIVKETKSQNLLIIVTGRGNHSPGNKPVLRPNILRWLKRKNYNVNERDPGALYVLIK